MTLDGFIQGAKTERAVAPERVERASDAVDTAKGFMEKVWVTKVNELTERSFGLRVHNGFQTPFVTLKDGNEAAIRRLATIEEEEYQLVAKTEGTDDPNYEGETYARVPVKPGATIEYARGVDASDISVALANDEEVVATFGEIANTLRQQYPDLQPTQAAAAA